MDTAPRIKTTTVGSYPVPAWLGNSPSEQDITDATRVILHTQETAGLDVVCDGEVYRYDLSHPETNGMIEYFTSPMEGIRSALTFDLIRQFESDMNMGWRRLPAGVVEGAISSGTMNLAFPCRRAKALAQKPFKFALTGPHMLAKTLVDHHYGSIEAVTDAIADVLAEQVARLDADIVQIDEANLPGNPEEWEWAAAAMNKVLDAVPGIPAVHLCFGNYAGQQPQDGNHIGTSDLADFLMALPAKEDASPETSDDLDEVVALATEAAGSTHPAILALKPADEPKPQEAKIVHDANDDFWMIETAIGEKKPLAVRLVVVGFAFE